MLSCSELFLISVLDPCISRWRFFGQVVKGRLIHYTKARARSYKVHSPKKAKSLWFLFCKKGWVLPLPKLLIWDIHGPNMEMVWDNL